MKYYELYSINTLCRPMGNLQTLNIFNIFNIFPTEKNTVTGKFIVGYIISIWNRKKKIEDGMYKKIFYYFNL